MWLYIPSACLAATAASTSESTPDWAESFARSVTWRGKLTRPQYWRRAWKKAPWLRRLSGATSPPSTLALGAARWISSLPDSPVRPSASPAAAKASKTNAGSGPKSSGWFASREPGWWRSKTCGGLFPIGEPLETYLGDWPTSGSLRNGYVFERPTWAPRIDGSDGSAWPTTRAEDAESSGAHRGLADTLTSAVREWPTVTARDHRSPNAQPSHLGQLPNYVAHLWVTPRAITGGAESGQRKKVLGRVQSGGGDLQSQASEWITPQAHDTAAGNPMRVGRYGAKAGGRNLTDEVTIWFPSPDANVMNDSEEWESFELRRASLKAKHKNCNGAGAPLAVFIKTPDAAFSLQAPTSQNGEPSSPNTLGSRRPSMRLNPWFVEWLMGLPFGWTLSDMSDSERSVMESYHSRPPRRSPSSRAD